jgi:uncharacterized protein (DUF1501 family)
MKGKPKTTTMNRRRFLGQTSCSAVGTTSLLSALINLRLTGSIAAVETEEEDYKALVCVFLAGGNDSFNMLAPVDEGLGYPQYLAARGEVALPNTDFTPLGDPLPAPDGRTLGLHNEMTELKALFDRNKAAFVNNVGTLVEPVTKIEVLNQSANLPLGLYSHSDQQLHWQSGLPKNRSPLNGWGGRMADFLNDLNGESQVSMNISLAGLNLFQSGATTSVLTRTSSSVPEIRNWQRWVHRHKRTANESMLNAEYYNAFEKSFAGGKKAAIAASREYRMALEGQDPLATEFNPLNSLALQLRAVAETIAARGSLSKKRQTFFVELGGWDHHNGLDEHPAMLGQLSEAVGQFYQSMEELGLEDKVTLFTASDFGRTLTPNGNGTDHAWGGNQFVVGGAVDGGKIYGEYPFLDLGNALDTGRGRFIPTTSVDEYVADLALWMGVSPGSLAEIVMPNLRNFHDVEQDGAPLGFMQISP